jgi:beta-galactosidase GanA
MDFSQPWQGFKPCRVFYSFKRNKISTAMKNTAILLSVTACLLAACTQQRPAEGSLPHLAVQGTATQLIVDGKPFLMLGGELGNSTAADVQGLDTVFAHLRQMGLNTVLSPVYWELTEPEEGRFDFTTVDAAVAAARAHGQKLVLLWFGAWKNSMSCYAPLWVKEDSRKYPRARTQSGLPVEIMTPFSDSNLAADRNAFAALMQHIAQIDGSRHTVIMIQVENEIGMIPDARDYSPEATELFNAPVPGQLIACLSALDTTLHPVLRERWETNGRKTEGNWVQIFGEGPETDEIFMAYHYGLFVEEVARAGKEAYPLPMYLNAALNSRGRKPGEYPSAGPLAHLIDVWRAAAPSIDFIAPDIYDPGFADWCAKYHLTGNPLFIPEIRMSDDNAAKVFYAFGAHDAMGFSPFSIENVRTAPLSKAYGILRQLAPLLAGVQGKGKTCGFLFDRDSASRIVEMGGYRLFGQHVYTFGWSPRAKDGSPWPEAGALAVQIADDEFLVAGTGVAVTFINARNDGSVTGIASIDKVTFADGKMTPSCRLNGDQTHQGRHLRIEAGEWDIQHIKLYRYE